MAATSLPGPTRRPVDTVAVVTGASRGLGGAMALRSAGDGRVVAVHYQRQCEAATSVAGEIERRGGRALVVQGDMASASRSVAAFICSPPRAIRPQLH